MKLVVALKLLPSEDQCVMLRRTLEAANAAANAISAVAWRERMFGQYRLHKLVYNDMRTSTSLTAQVVVRVISKVTDAYKLDKTASVSSDRSAASPTTTVSCATAATSFRSAR